jgi:RNA polymerase sigma-70 factor (ECF subfamily)
VLLLRDVLAWRAAEVATLLDTTTASVNSSLQRAHAQLTAVSPAEDEVDEPTDARQRELADRFAAAFENADMAGLVGLLTEGAALEMPPTPTWFAGASDVSRFLGTRVLRPGDWRLVPTAANGQPAFAMYMRAADGYAAHAIVVLTIATAGITRITMFHQPALFAGFGMPDTQ